MKPWHRLTLATVLGIAAGASLAVYRVRGGLSAGQITNGPWATAKTYGTKDADALTRARVALGGLLALPAKEAMYFTARTDSAGRHLDGKCTYYLNSQQVPARWWSVTAYDASGRLISSPTGRYSVGGILAFPGAQTASVIVGPKPTTLSKPIPLRMFVDTGGAKTFELTLRVYHPAPSILTGPEGAYLPSITRLSC